MLCNEYRLILMTNEARATRAASAEPTVQTSAQDGCFASAPDEVNENAQSIPIESAATRTMAKIAAATAASVLRLKYRRNPDAFCTIAAVFELAPAITEKAPEMPPAAAREAVAQP